MRRALVCLWLVATAAPAAAGSGHLPAHLGMYLPAPASGASAPELPMQASRVEVEVRGAIAEVVVHQTFHNDADHATEATYIFPLPEDAAVTALAITSGVRTIHAAIAKRADAQQRYEDAIAAGAPAALLEEERPDVFTQSVAAIPAGGDVEIVLRYDTTTRPRGDGAWELALPLVVAPRYVPGTASGRPTTGAGRAPDTDRAPDASRVTPGGKPDAGGATEIAIAFADPVEGVTSPTHELTARGRAYALRDLHSDHDALIRWRSKAAGTGWVEQDDDGGYAAVVVTAPPGKLRAAGAPALDLGLVLDRSALAHGDADTLERPLVRELLAGLTPADGVTVSGSASVPRAAPAAAWRELDRGWATSPGAFDLTRALAAAHGSPIVLVSPGLVADDAAALAAARALRTPIHVIGVGPAPNRALLAAIARDTGGTIRFAAPDDDAAALARDVLADLASPPPPLAVSWGALAASEVVPAALPRLGAGQARLVLARVQRAQAANARAQGDVFAITLATKAPAVTGEVTTRGPLARRWARERLGELLAARAPDVAAVTAHALRYGLVSPYTSMVAIGDEVVVRGGVKHTVAVPVSVPAGMRWQPLERELRVPTHAAREERGDEDARKAKGRKAADDAEPTRVATKHGPAPGKAPEPKPAPARDQSPRQPAPPPPPMAPPTEAPAPAAQTAAGNGAPRGAAMDSDGVEDAEAAPDKSDEARGRVALSSDVVESVSLATESRVRRLGLALGGGVLVDGATHGLVTITARLDGGRRLRYGGEAALSLVGAAHLHGQLLGTLGLYVGRLELALGAGLHLADQGGAAVGPAAGLMLHYALTPRFAPYLRYDAGVLFQHGDHDSEQAVSAGLEWRW